MFFKELFENIKKYIDYTKEDEVCVNGFETGYHTFELINLTEGKFINIKSIEPVAEEGYDMESCTDAKRVLYKLY